MDVNKIYVHRDPVDFRKSLNGLSIIIENDMALSALSGASANLYSLIKTAKANELEPYAYLWILFAELPKATTVDEIEALLPRNINLEQFNYM